MCLTLESQMMVTVAKVRGFLRGYARAKTRFGVMLLALALSDGLFSSNAPVVEALVATSDPHDGASQVDGVTRADTTSHSASDSNSLPLCSRRRSKGCFTTNDLYQNVNVISKPDETGKTFEDPRTALKDLPSGIASDDLKERVRVNTGYLFCYSSDPSVKAKSGSAALYGNGRQLTTALHVLYDYRGMLYSRCDFRNQEEKAQKVPLDLSKGGYLPFTTDFNVHYDKDLVAIRLKRPIKGAMPFPFGPAGRPLQPGDKVVAIAAHHDNQPKRFSLKEPIAEVCAVRKTFPKTSSAPTAVYTDCSSNGGSSGGILFKVISNGEWVMSASIVGSGLASDDFKPYSYDSHSVTAAVGLDAEVGERLQLFQDRKWNAPLAIDGDHPLTDSVHPARSGSDAEPNALRDRSEDTARVSSNPTDVFPISDRAVALGFSTGESDRAGKAIGSVMCDGKPVSSAALVEDAGTILTISTNLTGHCIFQNAANPPDRIEIMLDGSKGMQLSPIRRLKLRSRVGGAAPYKAVREDSSTTPKYMLFDAFFSMHVNPLQEPLIAQCEVRAGEVRGSGCTGVPGALEVAYVNGELVSLGMSEGKKVYPVVAVSVGAH